MSWISIDSAKPDPDQSCNVAGPLPEDRGGGYWVGSDTFTGTGWYDDWSTQPTHWQPLPPPPDAPAVTDEMVERAEVIGMLIEHISKGRPVVLGQYRGHSGHATLNAEDAAALLAALQPPNQ